jgi:hypothetical protein
MTVELRAGSGHGRRRRRAVAGVGAAMLIAAAAGVGFGLGRSVDDGSGDAADVVAPASESVGPDTTSPAPTASAPSAGTVVPEDDVAQSVDGDGPADTVVSPPASGGPGWSSWGGPAYESLYERTTDDGLVLRASRGEIWQTEGVWAVPAWEPEPWCSPDAELRVTLSGPGVVDVGGASWFADPVDGQAISWFTMGRADGRPSRIVVVQATDVVTEIAVRFDDGLSDLAAVMDGLAILAVPGEFADDWYHEHEAAPRPDGAFDVEFIGADRVHVVGSDEVMHWDVSGYEEACTPPPPALPEPGEQPVDPVASQTEIRDAMEALYDTSREIGNELALLDDPTGVEQAVAEMRTGASAELAEGVTAAIADLVFATPSEAWFRYDLVDADGGTLLAARYGIAVEIDGSWRITRATLCQDLSLAGGDCGESPIPAYEPVAEVLS